MNAKKFEFGSNVNEKFEQGESCTQSCRCYKFPFGEHMINLIDTPGLGDTRGVQQDEQNLEDILFFITQFTHIHCICILLKTNQARLSLYFKYVFDRTLSYLHVSASNNIVFVYTHSRSYNFTPGDTGPILIKMIEQFKKQQPAVDIKLNQKTQYCIDSEAFRYVIAKKQGFNFFKLISIITMKLYDFIYRV